MRTNATDDCVVTGTSFNIFNGVEVQCIDAIGDRAGFSPSEGDCDVIGQARTVDGIAVGFAAFAAGDRVATKVVGDDDCIVACAASDRIVAETRIDRIIARAGLNNVIGARAGDVIVACTAVNGDGCVGRRGIYNRLPCIAKSMSSSVGAWLLARKSAACMIWPDWQYPHCAT